MFHHTGYNVEIADEMNPPSSSFDHHRCSRLEPEWFNSKQDDFGNDWFETSKLHEDPDLVKPAVEKDPLSLDPTPIGPLGVQVVDNVSVEDTQFNKDDLMSIFSLEKADKIASSNSYVHEDRSLIRGSLSDCFSPSQSWKKQRLDDGSFKSISRSNDHLIKSNMLDLSNHSATSVSSNGEMSTCTTMSTGTTMSAGTTMSTGTTPSRFRLYQSENWFLRYQELSRYRLRYGHCLVEKDQYPILAQWIKRQRYQYKLKQEGKHSNLTDEREMALKQLGFIWDFHRTNWEERFNELILFKGRHGHCNVPSNFPENPQLAIWVRSQRRQFKLYKSKTKSTMTEERISRLNEIGFAWSFRV